MTTDTRYRTRDDMLGGLRRQIRALPGYAADTAEVGLADFADLLREVEAARSALVVTLVLDQGWSWGRVAAELDVSRQAARQRWSAQVETERAARAGAQ